MNRFTVFALSFLCIAVFGVALAQQSTQKDQPMLKAIFHINFGDSDRQQHGLENIKNIFKEVPAAELEVVCHGEGISLVTQSGSSDPELIAKLQDQGVKFVACQNTLTKKSLTVDDLLHGVSVVPSGAVAGIQKQSQGFGYFRP
jgi:uncharacterized protein